MSILTPKKSQSCQEPVNERPVSPRSLFTSIVLPLSLSLTVLIPLQAQSELGFGGISDPESTQVEERVEEQVEEQISERVGELGFGYSESKTESKVETNIEEGVEDSLSERLEERVEETTTEKVDDKVVEDVEDNVEASITETVEDNIAANIEESIEENIAAGVASNLENTVEESVEEGVEESVDEVVEQQMEESVASTVASTVENQLESEVDDVLDGIENEFEVSEDRIRKGQWLVMAEPEVFAELEEEGFLFDNITELPGMGMWLADVAAPSSFDIKDTRQGVIDVVGGERAEVDLNHIYTAGTTIASSGAGIAPRSALHFPVDTPALPLRMGMIDSAVDVSHPAFAASSVHSRSFVSENAERPDFHGTAIASIIAGNATDYVGLAPNTELFAAGVFEIDPEHGEIASTISLVKALDWQLSSGVDVINISLAGPPNRLLESALNRVAQRGVLIMAAAGNGGPGAEPMYPAAYPAVVAVTAVDSNHRIFRLANRGNYLDLAAPGVNMLHAKAGGGYASSSGTSFAVPFAATAAARLAKLHPGEDTMALLYTSAEDLGPKGRDDIYGYGLLRLTSSR